MIKRYLWVRIHENTEQQLSNFQAEFAWILKQPEAELKNGVAYKKTCIQRPQYKVVQSNVINEKTWYVDVTVCENIEITVRLSGMHL